MITLQADFNHIDAHGRLRLGDLRMHRQTPFAQIAGRHDAILFVDGEDVHAPSGMRTPVILDPLSFARRLTTGAEQAS
jgi:hypothetical protein